MPELNFITSENIIKAGEVVVILVALFAIVFIVRAFLEKMDKFEAGSNARQAEFNKAMTNHLHDLHQDKIKENETREMLAAAIGKFSEKLDNFTK